MRDPDTSYLCSVDKWGNAFSATPSDGSWRSPVVPGLGIIPSPRGTQSRPDPNHPCGIGPGRRPRLTPNPAIARRDDGTVVPFGAPGGDAQVQSMLQVFLNVFHFGMDVQEAIDAPRMTSHSFPSSFSPFGHYPRGGKPGGPHRRSGASGTGAPRPPPGHISRLHQEFCGGRDDRRRAGTGVPARRGRPAPAGIRYRTVEDYGARQATDRPNRYPDVGRTSTMGSHSTRSLYPKHRTLSWPRLTSVVDPERKWMALEGFVRLNRLEANRAGP